MIDDVPGALQSEDELVASTSGHGRMVWMEDLGSIVVVSRNSEDEKWIE